MKALEKVKAAAEKYPSIYCERGKEDETVGHNPLFLLEVHGITKSDLIRLERNGLALKARYVTKNTNPRWAGLPEDRRPDGPHRVRWILFKEAA